MLPLLLLLLLIENLTDKVLDNSTFIFIFFFLCSKRIIENNSSPSTHTHVEFRELKVHNNDNNYMKINHYKISNS